MPRLVLMTRRVLRPMVSVRGNTVNMLNILRWYACAKIYMAVRGITVPWASQPPALVQPLWSAPTDTLGSGLTNFSRSSGQNLYKSKQPSETVAQIVSAKQSDL